MRRAVVLLAALTTLAALPATAPAAEIAQPLPEIHCDPGPCFPQLDGARECVAAAARAIGGIINGTPQPQECDPVRSTTADRSALRPPPPHCDPMACPDPTADVKECLATLAIGKDPETGLPQVTCTAGRVSVSIG